MNAAAPYLAVLSAEYRMNLQYRAAALAGVATQLFWGFVRMIVIGAFYQAATAEPPMSYAQVVSYIWLGQATLGLLPWRTEPAITAMIRTGHVAYELARPVDTFALWSARTAAMLTARTTLRALPIVVIAGFLLPQLGLKGYALTAPASWAAAGWFALAMAGAVALSTALVMLMHVVMMWTLSHEGINRVLPIVSILLSGSLLPLALFPDWAQPWLALQPFAGLVDTPFRIYGGGLVGAEAAGRVALSFAWAAALFMAGRWIMARGFRQLVVQGG